MWLNPRDDRDHDVRDRVYARVYDHGRGRVYARVYDHGHGRVYDHDHDHGHGRVYDHVCVRAYGHDRHLHGNAHGELYLIKVLHPQDRQW